LSAGVAIRECRKAGVTTYTAGAPCPGGWGETRAFYTSHQAIPGVTAEVYLCSRVLPGLGARTFVSQAEGRTCEGGGSFIGPLGTRLSGTQCGAVAFNRYYNRTTGDSMISPTAPPGYQLEGPIGGFWLTPVNPAQCCLADSVCGAGTICATPLTACVPGCRRDSQCGGGKRCIANQCVDACRIDEDCAVGQVCNQSACRPGCRSDEACTEEQRCVNTTCVPR
jgi:hypothetical protein